MSDLLIKNMGIPKDKPIGVVIHPSGRVEVPDSFDAGFSYPRVVGVNLLRAHEITDHGDLIDRDYIKANGLSLNDAPVILEASTEGEATK